MLALKHRDRLVAAFMVVNVEDGKRLVGANSNIESRIDQRQHVARARQGTRNQTLNNAALALGHLAHYAAFTKDEVRATLEAASEANGYTADDGRGAFEATFSGAWKDGLAEPREILWPAPC